MYWEPSRARTLSIHWPSSYFSGVLGALKVSQRCKTAQLSSSAHSDRIQRDADTTFSRELSCAKLCCWVLFSYISGLLEDRAIIQSSLMRWSHSFRLGWRPQTGRWLSAISLSARAVAQQRRCYTDVTCKQAHVTQSPIPLCVLSMLQLQWALLALNRSRDTFILVTVQAVYIQFLHTVPPSSQY